MAVLPELPELSDPPEEAAGWDEPPELPALLLGPDCEPVLLPVLRRVYPWPLTARPSASVSVASGSRTMITGRL